MPKILIIYYHKTYNIFYMLTIAKAFTGFGGVVTLLIGLGFLAATIWAFVNKVLVFNQN